MDLVKLCFTKPLACNSLAQVELNCHLSSQLTLIPLLSIACFEVHLGYFVFDLFVLLSTIYLLDCSWVGLNLHRGLRVYLAVIFDTNNPICTETLWSWELLPYGLLAPVLELDNALPPPDLTETFKHRDNSKTIQGNSGKIRNKVEVLH